MLKNIAQFYKAGDEVAPIADADVIKRTYTRKRIEVFLSITVGYGFYYVARLILSVAKKPMLDAGVMDVEQMGLMGSAMLIFYAFGKFANGFLADRCNMKSFIPTGLMVSAVINLVLGFNTAFWVFLVLWALNGWFRWRAEYCVIGAVV